jgi:hypothetical protein
MKSKLHIFTLLYFHLSDCCLSCAIARRERKRTRSGYILFQAEQVLAISEFYHVLINLVSVYKQ